MPVVDINPNNSGTIKLGTAAAPTTDYACQVINFVIEPVPNSVPSQGTFCRAPGTRTTASSYQVSFEYLQDWGATNSISSFMKDNDGQLVYFEFDPDVPTASTASGSFWAQAGSYGGLAGDSWTSSGTCPLEGDWTETAPVAALAATEDTPVDAEAV